MYNDDNDEVKSVTLSALAKSTKDFSSWATGAGLQRITSPSETVDSIFDELCEFQLPTSFTSIPKQLTFHGEKEFYESLRTWKVSNEDLVTRHDVYNMKAVSGILYMSYYSIREAVRGNQSEAAQRRGVDTVMELAFSSRIQGNHTFGVEQPMKLCKSASTVSVSPKALADAVVMIPIPGPLMDKIEKAVRDSIKVEDLEEIRLRLYWKPEAVDENSLMAFVGESKKRPNAYNRNQLLADLLTAQSQRRAFGLPDIIVWGAVCSAGQFQVYSSRWDDKRKFVEWSAHHTWDLTVPIDFLKCYCFLCSLSNNLSEAHKALGALDPAAVAQSCTRFPWYASPRPQPKENRKGPHSDDDEEQAAGPSNAGIVDDAGSINLEYSEMLDDLSSDRTNAGGRDDLDAEEAASWDKAARHWREEAAQMPSSDTLSEGYVKNLHIDKAPIYDRHQGLISWRSSAF